MTDLRIPYSAPVDTRDHGCLMGACLIALSWLVIAAIVARVVR